MGADSGEHSHRGCSVGGTVMVDAESGDTAQKVQSRGTQFRWLQNGEI